jgi:hypothetical protein
MAFSETETSKILQTLETNFWSKHRPPTHMRDKIREGQRIEKQSVELFYVRPVFEMPGRTVEESISKITYVRTQKVWKIFWQRADLKWHGYPECPEVRSLDEALRVINKDKYHCFFG